MKILVTGGAGFVGSHLVDALLEKGHSVAIIDNLKTGLKENVHPQAVFHKADLRDAKKMEKIFQKEKPEVVYHLAAEANVRKSLENTHRNIEINVAGSFDVIDLCSKYKVKKIIFSSSGGTVYGQTKNRPTGENEIEKPLSPYGISKLTVDKYLEYKHRIFGLKYISLRYGNIYGPRQNPKGEFGIISIFISKMSNGETAKINGSGKQTRDYVYIDDITRANLLALEKFQKVGTFNVGTGKETDLLNLWNEIGKYFQKENRRKVHVPHLVREQKNSCLDSKKIGEELGWKAKIDLKEGIGKTIEWHKNRSLTKKGFNVSLEGQKMKNLGGFFLKFYPNPNNWRIIKSIKSIII